MATGPAVPELKCFCINLDSRPERWAQVQEAFANTGIAIERFPGIKHDNGMKGCGASHVAVIREAQKRNLPWVMVIEDDCQPVADFKDRFPGVKDALWKTRGQWDIFLGGPGWIDGPVRPLTEGGLYEFRKGVLLHLYVMDASAYEKAAAWNPDRDGPIDEYFSIALRKVTIEPPYLASQRPSMSNIRKTNVDYNGDLKQSEEKMRKLIQESKGAGAVGGGRRRAMRASPARRRRRSRTLKKRAMKISTKKNIKRGVR
jgi:glycosyl transferase family 25